MSEGFGGGPPPSDNPTRDYILARARRDEEEREDGKRPAIKRPRTGTRIVIAVKAQPK